MGPLTAGEGQDSRSWRRKGERSQALYYLSGPAVLEVGSFCRELFSHLPKETASAFDALFTKGGNATILVGLRGKTGNHLALEGRLPAAPVDTWSGNTKTRDRSALALQALSLPVLTSAHNPMVQGPNMEVFFPKFQLDQKYCMYELLEQMVIGRIFQLQADLCDLSVASRNWKVSKVLQRAGIEVDEKGAEAVTGTLLEMTADSMPPIIRIDQPRHFMIYEETSGMLLFRGRVVNPALLRFQTRVSTRCSRRRRTRGS
ncbi:LOW QUALITY PROTEIN: protein Z-dependent protease inhibitor-like [Lynx rufus]|uniref:LOW QUALITY PROTEIN: protein Z-dependent protease inhibitor-like n=1 Tax=Lynx rufus TaxID=61384 RepID=UPI001F123579|nr:LOW QUALITY PROTEIN: protein Z-dependent protease inhibitor-like [Lynx rufus]